MRTKLSLLFLAILILIAGTVWFGERRPSEASSSGSNGTQAAPQQTDTPIAAAASPTSTPKVVVAFPNSSSTDSAPSRSDQIRNILSAYNDVPIDFYGKVVDQFGNSVSGAQVKGSIRMISGVRQGSDWLSTTSDADGRFEFHGKGQDIGMAPNKQGYAFLSMAGTGNYSRLFTDPERAHPDPNNPVILKMWKLQGGESLIHFSFNTRLKCDGKPLSFDFQTGKVVDSGGDMSLSLGCPMQPDANQPYDWRATLRMIDGGVLPEDSPLELKFQAPDSGYQPEFETNKQRDSTPWSSSFHGGFYFKSRGGVFYGKFDVGIVIYAIKDVEVPVTLEGYVNPAGSPNLEIDPNRVKEAHP